MCEDEMLTNTIRFLNATITNDIMICGKKTTSIEMHNSESNKWMDELARAITLLFLLFKVHSYMLHRIISQF